MKKILIFAVSMLLCGCDNDYTGKTPSLPGSISEPGFVADFSDGRKLYRIIIQTDGASHVHYVYFFNKPGQETVTINHTVKAGKSTRNETTAIIPE